MRIVEADTNKPYAKWLKKKYQTWHGRKLFSWLDQIQDEMVRRGLVHDSNIGKANFRAEAFALMDRELGRNWNYNQEHDTFKKENGKWVERPWNERGYGPIACRDTCVNAVNDYMDKHDPNNNRFSYDEFKVKDYVTPGKKITATAPDGSKHVITSAEISDPAEPLRIGLLYYWTKKTRLLKGEAPSQVDVNLQPGTSDFNTYQIHRKALLNYLNAGKSATNEQRQNAIDADNYMRQIAYGSYNGGPRYRQSSDARKYAEVATKTFKDLQGPVYQATIRDWFTWDDTKHNKMIKKVSPTKPGSWAAYLIGDDEDETGVADQIVKQLSYDVVDFVKKYPTQFMDKYKRWQKSGSGDIGDLEKDIRNQENRGGSFKTEPTVTEPVKPEVEPMTTRLKQPTISKDDSEETVSKLKPLRPGHPGLRNESTIKEDFETHQHSTREVVTSFVKNILKLNASGSQIDKFMSQLDVTDIIAIHRAMASGNFDKLSLGEKLQEYITPAQKDKEKQPIQQTEPTRTLAPVEPNEPTRIAGNNPNPEMPPTGASQSTRKPVPSMKRSEVKRNAVITNPDTGEEFLVTNDLVASQMMQRAKRISA
jgi:hypothetical protein